MKQKIILLPILIILAIGYFLFISKKTSIQNPEKGMLILNTDKQIYVPGETAYIQIVSVDASGKVLCNSNLKLEINGQKIDDLKKSSTCEDGGITVNPDYFYYYKIGQNNNYNIKLTDIDSGQTVQKSFKVVEKRDLDVTRIATSRINTEKETRYPVAFSVKSFSDYKGEFTDTIPAEFNFAWWGPAEISNNPDGNKKITWKLDLKAGETVEFAYEFIAPKTSPLIYTLGENSEWQVVSAK